MHAPNSGAVHQPDRLRFMGSYMDPNRARKVSLPIDRNPWSYSPRRVQTALKVIRSSHVKNTAVKVGVLPRTLSVLMFGMFLACLALNPSAMACLRGDNDEFG